MPIDAGGSRATKAELAEADEAKKPRVFTCKACDGLYALMKAAERCLECKALDTLSEEPYVKAPAVVEESEK